MKVLRNEIETVINVEDFNPDTDNEFAEDFVDEIKLKKSEIINKLEEKGIEFSKSMKKDELQALLDA